MKPIHFALALSLVGSFALAGGLNKKRFAPTTLTTQDSVQTSEPQGHIYVAPGYARLDDTSGWGSAVGFDIHATGGLYFGIESGYYQWKDSGDIGSTSLSATAKAIPIMGSVMYRFGNGSIRPYLGAAAGISLNTATVDITTSGTSKTISGNSTTFMGVVRPGVEFGLSQGMNLMLEPKVGIIEDTFFLAPQLGLAFSL